VKHGKKKNVLRVERRKEKRVAGCGLRVAGRRDKNLMRVAGRKI